MTSHVEAIFVFRATSDRDIGQLWIPAKNCGKRCDGLSKFQLGQWLIYDFDNEKIIRAMPAGEEPYETEVCGGNPEGEILIHVKTPIIYFSDQAFNEVKAYSPKFGNIGSFFKQKNIVMDQLNYAWIRYMALYPDMDFRKILKVFDADWVVFSTDEGGLSKEEIRQEIAKGHCNFVNGIVVKCEEQFEVEDNMDDDAKEEEGINEGGSSIESTNLLDNKYKLKIWTALHIWTPNLDGKEQPGIAIHRIEGEMRQQKKLLKMGELCKMMLAENWSKKMVAVSPMPIELNGIKNIVSQESKVKLKIHQSQFILSGGNICVPSIIGPIDCASPDDIQEIRDQKPTNIFVEFGDNKWTFAGIDLAKDSPPPIEPPPKTEHRQIGELEEQPTTLVGGFGQNSRDRFSKFRTPKTVLPTINVNADNSFSNDCESPPALKNELPKIQNQQIGLTGGFEQNARGDRGVRVEATFSKQRGTPKQISPPIPECEFSQRPLQLPRGIGKVIVEQEKVFAPTKEFPNCNFAGRIIGPRGIIAKQLSMETGCRIIVRGRGSMHFKMAEKNRGKPNFEHLDEELHVIIQSRDTPNRNAVKIARAVEEVSKLLFPPPEGEDELKRKQLMQLAIIKGTFGAGIGSSAGGGGIQSGKKVVPSTSQRQRRLSNSSWDSEVGIPRAIDITPPNEPTFSFSAERPTTSSSSFGHLDFGKKMDHK